MLTTSFLPTLFMYDFDFHFQWLLLPLDMRGILLFLPFYFQAL